ncbi:MAG TPA: class I SAM-dependent methyltransferase [Candidatus Omnitrophota bacterium]|nr:class I SAM-dependent methyltransferase [Candidatus Omnitrophota bacterium]HPS36563.1 class I SAM-dependent methyltransferase [Candidatus Omnitrophota bacterium]
MKKYSKLEARTRRFYEDKLRQFGPTPEGAGWNSEKAQEIRFDQLLGIVGKERSFSLNEYGCGCGALVRYLKERRYRVRYCGFDILKKAIAKAKALYAGRPGCRFTSCEQSLKKADYTVASGIFNVKQETPVSQWDDYVKAVLLCMAKVSVKGMAFNMLTAYSDPERMRQELFYPQPAAIFDFCKRNLSRRVSLIHDYELYDFTVHVRF